MKIFESIDNLYSRHKKNIDIALIVIVLVSFYFAIFNSVFRLDDLIYMMKWDSNMPLQSISDIIDYQYQHYFLWGGRTIAHFVLQILLFINKPISALIITLAFFSLGIIIYKYAFTNMKIDWLKVSFILGILYFLNPSADETLFWYTGIANYLITTLIVLCSFYPYLLYIKGNKLKNIHYLLLLLTFFAGWCNENISTTLIVMIIVVLMIKYKENKKINLFLLMGLFAAAFGCCMLLFAPGNFVRASTFSGSIMQIMYRGYGQVNAWFNWFVPALILIIITLNFNKINSLSMKNRLILIWSFLSIIAMLASPIYPSRATFGTLTLLIISILINCEENSLFADKKIIYIALFISISFIFVNLSIGILQFVRNLGYYIPG